MVQDSCSTWLMPLKLLETSGVIVPRMFVSLQQVSQNTMHLLPDIAMQALLRVVHLLHVQCRCGPLAVFELNRSSLGVTSWASRQDPTRTADQHTLFVSSGEQMHPEKGFCARPGWATQNAARHRSGDQHPKFILGFLVMYKQTHTQTKTQNKRQQDLVLRTLGYRLCLQFGPHDEHTLRVLSYFRLGCLPFASHGAFCALPGTRLGASCSRCDHCRALAVGRNCPSKRQRKLFHWGWTMIHLSLQLTRVESDLCAYHFWCDGPLD